MPLSGAPKMSLRTRAAASSRFSVSLTDMEMEKGLANDGVEIGAVASKRMIAIGANFLESTVRPPCTMQSQLGERTWVAEDPATNGVECPMVLEWQSVIVSEQAAATATTITA